jgi:TRAP-type uncharacterized transport system fused permease subunit
MIFSAMSGVAQADAAGLGLIEIKAMRERGFDPAFSAAVSAASAIIGPIIPPSVIMVIYGLLAQVSVGDLFLAGILPGVLMGFSLMGMIYFLAAHGPHQGAGRAEGFVQRGQRELSRRIACVPCARHARGRTDTWRGHTDRARRIDRRLRCSAGLLVWRADRKAAHRDSHRNTDLFRGFWFLSSLPPCRSVG